MISFPSAQEPLLFVVSAPSGAGKTSLCTALAGTVPHLSLSVSHTTRTPRKGEVEGNSYYFISTAMFQEYVREGAMAEWTELYGNCYGTAHDTIRRAMSSGHDLLFDIDERGARQLSKAYRHVVTILVLPPSLNDLQQRLLDRGTEDEASVNRRLERARQEVRNMLWYEYLVVNSRFQDAVDQLKAIVSAERCKRGHEPLQEFVRE